MESLAPTLEKAITILKEIQSISNTTADIRTIEDKMSVFVDLEKVINGFPIQKITLLPNKVLWDEYVQLKKRLNIN